MDRVPAVGGESAATGGCRRELAAGDTLLETRLRVPHHRLWQLNDPYLYRVTASVQAADSRPATNAPCAAGFAISVSRTVISASTAGGFIPTAAFTPCCNIPAQSVPYDADLVRRDVLNMKAAGFNICGLHAAPPCRPGNSMFR